MVFVTTDKESMNQSNNLSAVNKESTSATDLKIQDLSSYQLITGSSSNISLMVSSTQPKSQASGRVNKNRTMLPDNQGILCFELINKIKFTANEVEEIAKQTGIKIIFTEAGKKLLQIAHFLTLKIQLV